MLVVVDIFLCALLGIILWQDLRERQISALLIPALAIGFSVRTFWITGVGELLSNGFMNFLFVALQLLLISAYFSFRNRKLTNIIDSYIGLGDVLFFIVLCLAFSPMKFVLFYITALLVSLLSVLIYQSIFRKRLAEIPLAGIFSMLVIGIIISDHGSNTVGMTSDASVLNLFEKW